MRCQCLFGIDNGFVDGIPPSGSDTPIVGGVLVAVDSYELVR